MKEGFAMLSCDTLVALGCVTSAGRTLFAKNSDRPLAKRSRRIYTGGRI
jgi:dipeptidase